jgi:hypothetical protein
MGRIVRPADWAACLRGAVATEVMIDPALRGEAVVRLMRVPRQRLDLRLPIAPTTATRLCEACGA